MSLATAGSWGEGGEERGAASGMVRMYACESGRSRKLGGARGGGERASNIKHGHVLIKGRLALGADSSTGGAWGGSEREQQQTWSGMPAHPATAGS